MTRFKTLILLISFMMKRKRTKNLRGMILMMRVRVLKKRIRNSIKGMDKWRKVEKSN